MVIREIEICDAGTGIDISWEKQNDLRIMLAFSIFDRSSRKQVEIDDQTRVHSNHI